MQAISQAVATGNHAIVLRARAGVKCNFQFALLRAYGSSIKTSTRRLIQKIITAHNQMQVISFQNLSIQSLIYTSFII